jgi:hypothetical protein
MGAVYRDRVVPGVRSPWIPGEEADAATDTEEER